MGISCTEHFLLVPNLNQSASLSFPSEKVDVTVVFFTSGAQQVKIVLSSKILKLSNKLTV